MHLQKYLEEVRQIHYTGTTGIYLDPTQDPNKIIEDLKLVRPRSFLDLIHQRIYNRFRFV
jgi:hypothetical protein